MNYKIFFHLHSHKIFLYLFLALFSAQIFFWYKTEKIKSSYDIVPAVPSKYLISAASLGDKEFLFRTLSMRLQNSGDIFAGFVALKYYDYARLYQWLLMLDDLNSVSNFVPSLATYYYSQTQKIEDRHYIVDYLDFHASKNIDEKWWWLFQAVNLSLELKNNDRALELAYKLSQNNAKNAPLWTKEMPAIIHEKMGDGCLAFGIIEKLIKESESGARQITPEEMNFMRYFIRERLSKLKSKKFDPRKCH